MQAAGPASSSPTDVSVNLDVLRVIAVSAVLVDHTLRFLGYEDVGPVNMNALGRVGVLFFFVHTCLVLMLSLQRQARTAPDAPLTLPFLVRRAFRVYPLSMLFVVAIAALGLPGTSISAGHVNTLVPSIGQLVANLLLVQNLVFPVNVLGPLWSLPLEVQMYVLLPALFTIAIAPRGGWKLLGIWAVTAVVAVLLPMVPGHGRLSLITFMPNFIPGVMAFVLLRNVQPRLPAWTFPLSVIALGVLYLAVPDKITGWLICLGLGAIIPLSRDIRSPLVAKPSFTIAKYSYGVYLSHVLCIWAALELLAGYSPIVRWSAYVALLVAIPLALYHLVERPGIQIGSRVAERFQQRRRAAALAPDPA